jgi:hypothetical protein
MGQVSSQNFQRRVQLYAVFLLLKCEYWLCFFAEA